MNDGTDDSGQKTTQVRVWTEEQTPFLWQLVEEDVISLMAAAIYAANVDTLGGFDMMGSAIQDAIEIRKLVKETLDG